MSVHIQNSPARAYREAGEAKDLDALLATLAPGVAFHSPLSANAGFTGHEDLRGLFTGVFAVVGSISYHTDVGDDRTRMVAATARVRGQEIEESALLRFGDDGLIEELTLWVRPLPGLTALMAALGTELASASGRRGLALLVGAATRPLAAMTRLGDRTLVPMVAGTPRR